MAAENYLPHTAADIDRMLKRCGAEKLDDLYSDVPEQLRLKCPYKLPKGISEPELARYFDAIAAENKPLRCFAGAGFYHH